MKFHSSKLYFFNTGAKGIPPAKCFPREMKLCYGNHSLYEASHDYHKNVVPLLPEKICAQSNHGNIAEVEVCKNTGKVVKYILRLNFVDKVICLVIGLNVCGTLNKVFTVWSNNIGDNHSSLKNKLDENNNPIPWSNPALLWK